MVSFENSRRRQAFASRFLLEYDYYFLALTLACCGQRQSVTINMTIARQARASFRQMSMALLLVIRAFDQEVFEDKASLASLQGSAATATCYFAVA
jgi:hypothetical protein